jgi:hypothetical protein
LPIILFLLFSCHFRSHQNSSSGFLSVEAFMRAHTYRHGDA